MLRELALYGELRRNQARVDLPYIFPGIRHVDGLPYPVSDGFKTYEFDVFQLDEPPAIITLRQESSVLDGFTTLRVKIVSRQPEAVADQIKKSAPYFSELTPVISQASGGLTD